MNLLVRGSVRVYFEAPGQASRTRPNPFAFALDRLHPQSQASMIGSHSYVDAWPVDAWENEMALDIADQKIADPAGTSPARKTRSGKELIYRHTLFVRLTHWINVLCIALLLMSGLQIFNAHPMLHWGIKGGDTDPAVLSIYGEDQLDGSAI